MCGEWWFASEAGGVSKLLLFSDAAERDEEVVASEAGPAGEEW